VPSPEFERNPILGENYSIKAESPLLSEETHVEGMEIGCSQEMRGILEKMISQNSFNSEGLREALAGMTVSFSLEHVPRLVHDLITEGRDTYSAQSWRYVTMHIREGDLSRIHPPECIKNTALNEKFLELAAFSIDTYNQMVEMGIPEEDARFVYLWSFDSNIVVTLQGPKLVDFAIDNLNSPYQIIRVTADEVIETFGRNFPKTARNLRQVAVAEGVSLSDRMRIEEMRKVCLYGYEKTIEVHSLGVDPVEKAATAAKTCYQELPPSDFIKGFTREAQKATLRRRIKSGHTSVLEHPHFLILFSMSEATRQQIRRHRIPVQRLAPAYLVALNYKVVIPPSIEANPQAKVLYLQVFERSKEFFNLGQEMGFQESELVHGLLMGIEMPSFLVTNVTDIHHMSRRRLCNRAQWEPRDFFYQLAEILIKNYPTLFERLGPDCYLGKCQESESCGHPEIYRRWRQTL
jgi:thymidylate synthase (FAD)